MPSAAPRRLTAGLVLLLAITLTGCGHPGPTPASGGHLAALADLHGASYAVAGGATSEMHILCQLTIAAVQAAGAHAEDQCGKVGAADVRRSSQQTEVDTGWAYLGRPDRDGGDPAFTPGGTPATSTRPAPADPAEVARSDGSVEVTRLAPTAFGDVDAVVVAPPVADGTRTLSQLAARPGPFCVTPEAAADPARWPAVAQAYGLVGPVEVLDPAAVFAGVATGHCTAGEVPPTSGRIPALALTALVDDRNVLGRGPSGRGGATPVLRTATFLARPRVAVVLGAITSRLDDPTMRELNREADQDGRDPREIARHWLVTEGLITRG